MADAFNPDGSQAVNDNELWAYPARLTWQMSRKNRLTGLFNFAEKKAGHHRLTSAQSARGRHVGRTSPARRSRSSNGRRRSRPACSSRRAAAARCTTCDSATSRKSRSATCHVAFNLCPPGTGYGSIPHLDTLLNKTTVAPRATTAPGAGRIERPALSQVVNVSLSYVSGAHALKVGFQNRYGWPEDIRAGVNGDLNQLYRNGVPFAVEVLNTPILSRGRREQPIWASTCRTRGPGGGSR